MSLCLAPLVFLTLANVTATDEVTQPLHTAVSSDGNTAGRDPFRERPFLIEIQLGIATPTGVVGAYLDYALIPALSLAAGGGTNLVGFEAAAELRLRLILKPGHALGLMAGYSLGPYSQTDANQGGVFALFLAPLAQMGEGRFPSAYRWDLAHWANLAVTYERRKPGRMNLRIFAGPAFLLNPSDGQPTETENVQQKRHWEPVSTLIFAGVGLGHTR